MKKLFPLLLTAIIAIATTSCKDDDDIIKLATSETTLNYQDKFQIDVTSDLVINYESQDEYIATVSATGLITAGHVGTTLINISSGNEVKQFKVTVEPKYTTYETPFIEWGATPTQVVSKFGKNYYFNEEYNTISYEGLNSEYVLQTRFLFNDNDQLYSSAVYFDAATFGQVALYLYERYQFVESGELEDGRLMHFFVDGLTSADVKMSIAVLEIDDTTFTVIYMPYEDDSANTSSAKSTLKRKAISAKIGKIVSNLKD